MAPKATPFTPSSDPSVGSRIEGLSDDVIDALVARADGVPLYVEELTKAMAEPGAPRGVEAIPASLADSLMARLDRLSTAKEVAQRAAVLGREFGYPLLAALMEMPGMDEAALRQGLARLVDAEILFARGEPPAATYTFKHALIQETAYQSLLKRTRQQLHGRVLDVLVAQFPERTAAEPEVVARHAQVAGRNDEAIASYQRAGEQAQARSAHAEAIALLRQALALLTTLPESADRHAREIALQFTLRVSLMKARGHGHRAIESALERTRVLCEAVGDRLQLGMALSHLANYCVNRGQPDRAIALGEQSLEIAHETDADALLVIGNFQLCMAEYYRGNFAKSLEHHQQMVAIYDPARHGQITRNGEVGVGEGVAAHPLWQLGYPDRALQHARAAVALAHTLAYPFGLALSLFFETVVHWLRGDTASQRELAEQLIALSETHGFSLLLAGGKSYHGAALAAAGAAATGLAEISDANVLAAGSGTRGGAPLMLGLIASVRHAAGQPGEALAALEMALAVSAHTGQPFHDAELHRLKGEIVLVDNQQSRVDSEKIAEECFRQGLEIARGQDAKSFELRAATSLARLWQRQGKRDAARDLLAPVYGWFTEGFDTRDLKEARALLEELSR